MFVLLGLVSLPPGWLAERIGRKALIAWFSGGFLGSAAAASVAGIPHERTGNLAAITAVLAGVALVTPGCAWLFPDRLEELRPKPCAGPPGTVPAEQRCATVLLPRHRRATTSAQ